MIRNLEFPNRLLLAVCECGADLISWAHWIFKTLTVNLLKLSHAMTVSVVSSCRLDIDCASPKASEIPCTISGGDAFHIKVAWALIFLVPRCQFTCLWQDTASVCELQVHVAKALSSVWALGETHSWSNIEMLVCDDFPQSLVCFKSLFACHIIYAYSDTFRICLELFVNPPSPPPQIFTFLHELFFIWKYLLNYVIHYSPQEAKLITDCTADYIHARGNNQSLCLLWSSTGSEHSPPYGALISTWNRCFQSLWIILWNSLLIQKKCWITKEGCQQQNNSSGTNIQYFYPSVLIWI